MPPAQVKYMTDKIPKKRCCTHEEVTSVVLFAASKRAMNYQEAIRIAEERERRLGDVGAGGVAQAELRERREEPRHVLDDAEHAQLRLLAEGELLAHVHQRDLERGHRRAVRGIARNCARIAPELRAHLGSSFFIFHGSGGTVSAFSRRSALPAACPKLALVLGGFFFALTFRNSSADAVCITQS